MFSKIKLFLFLFYFFSSCLFGKQIYFKKIKFEGLYSVDYKKVIKGIRFVSVINSELLIEHLVYMEAFDYIKLRSIGSTLIITVKEKPLIRSVRVFGERLDSESLRFLNEYRIRKGEFYDYAFMRLLEHDLENYHINFGFINNRLRIEVDFYVSINVVDVKIYQEKNEMTKVDKIWIFGNTVFTEKKIISFFSFYQKNFISFLIHDQIIFREQIAEDLESLKNSYYNKGYMEFQINTFKVFLSKDKENLCIIVDLFEGGVFDFGDVFIYKGIRDQLKADCLDLLKSVIVKDTMFNIDDVNAAKEHLEYFIKLHRGKNSKIGFKMDNVDGFANISFSVHVYRRSFLHSVNFTGNIITKDHNLRYFVNQIENGEPNYKNIKDCRENIIKYNYAKDAEIIFLGSKIGLKSIDLYYYLDEKNSNKLLASISYYPGDSYGLNFSLESPNCLGTGHDILFNIYKTYNMLDLALTCFDPNNFKSIFDVTYNMYLKIEGDEDEFINYDHTYLTVGFSMDYSLNFFDFNKITLGVGYETYDFVIDRDEMPTELLNFINHHGSNFREYYLFIDYIYDNLNKSEIFPSQGIYSHFNFKITLPRSNLNYFQINYELACYYPVRANNIFSIFLSFFYGDIFGKYMVYYPFFKNNFLKGVTNVRGFRDRTLGPRTSTFDYIGGNITFALKFELSFPTPIINDQDIVKSSFFIDIGQVYTNDKNLLSHLKSFKYLDYDQSPRVSVGYAFSWNTPFGVPVDFAIAYPLCYDSSDSITIFSFVIGGVA